MKTGSVFCVRSMTQPLIGASILMLIQEGALHREVRFAQYLPSFDVEATRDITILLVWAIGGGGIRTCM